MSEKGKSMRRSKLYEVFAHFIEGRKFLRKCIKPSKREFITMWKMHIGGILFLGAMGYVIKLVHIPINNIIVNTPK